MGEKKRFELDDYEFEEINGKWLLKRNDSFYEIDWNASESLISKLNKQQSIINKLQEENASLKQKIKENVFGGYRKGSLADLELKAIAYDDIIKLETSYESEPKVVVICKRGKRENVKSFCQMFIPFGIAYEIVEMIDDE